MFGGSTCPGNVTVKKSQPMRPAAKGSVIKMCDIAFHAFVALLLLVEGGNRNIGMHRPLIGSCPFIAVIPFCLYVIHTLLQHD